MRYDFECDSCGVEFVANFAMAEVPETTECPACLEQCKRAWRAPQMLVRGEKKGGRTEEDFDPAHWGCDVPARAKAMGYDSKRYEELHRKERKVSEAQKREHARRVSGGRHLSGGLRPIGEIPQAKFYAMMRENGGEMPSTDQLKKRGCIYEHEKRNV